MPQKRPAVKAKNKVVGFAELYPDMDLDTAGGKTITRGCIIMQTYAGKATGTYKGKPYEITLGASLAGATVLQASNGRKFVVNIRAMVRAALRAGLLNSKSIKFERDFSRK